LGRRATSRCRSCAVRETGRHPPPQDLWTAATHRRARNSRHGTTSTPSTASFGLTLIGGLTTATLLTLLVVPVFYTFFDDARLVTGRAIRHALGTTPAERAQA
jgi:hypothetical protein